MKIDQHIVYLSIGSNIGDKKKNLNDATAILNRHDKIDVVDVSSFYKTEPQNFTDQDWFVNAALKIRTALTPEDLIAVIKTLEKDLDKDGKPFRFGPRIIDIDIIYFDNLVLKTRHLEIPHPRMHERCFVLIPICDIGAHTIHPVLNLRSDDLLKKIEKQETQKVILLDKEV
ncbi:2-amino-4-hydroxy-6-hydroxymethyldihydropteridine diphosphokinase [Desulfobacula sp.]|uniref:2-amino-4-hydroxy-6- hydroxymethyldihydropteridine diphosphokinase n=1 Tax=Desulfobacula sp. TaxID=2593537 RepID=UPI001ECD3344|nr:2-amino-4-hydroxy-6-hydroxymethyldihydropteridine diphosphokinase [Desulfobacula sp.]